MCYTNILSHKIFFLLQKFLFDTIDDVRKMMLENIAFEKLRFL